MGQPVRLLADHLPRGFPAAPRRGGPVAREGRRPPQRHRNPDHQQDQDGQDQDGPQTRRPRGRTVHADRRPRRRHGARHRLEQEERVRILRARVVLRQEPRRRERAVPTRVRDRPRRRRRAGTEEHAEAVPQRTRPEVRRGQMGVPPPADLPRELGHGFPPLLRPRPADPAGAACRAISAGVQGDAHGLHLARHRLDARGSPAPGHLPALQDARYAYEAQWQGRWVENQGQVRGRGVRAQRRGRETLALQHGLPARIRRRPRRQGPRRIHRAHAHRRADPHRARQEALAGVVPGAHRRGQGPRALDLQARPLRLVAWGGRDEGHRPPPLLVPQRPGRLRQEVRHPVRGAGGRRARARADSRGPDRARGQPLHRG